MRPDGADAGASPAAVKTEVVFEFCGAPEPSGDFDPAGGPEAESSDTDDSGDYWRDETRKPERTGEGAQRSPRSGAAASQGCRTPPPPFGCNVCGESFRRRSLLLAHAAAAHPSDRGRETTENLKRHLGAHEAAAVAHPSDHGWETTENLKRHLGAHEAAAEVEVEAAAAAASSFPCGVCGRSFTLRGNLRTHMRIHSGERPHGCAVCGKSFGRRATLVRHVRGHTGEKPFSCVHCGRGFVEKGNLTVHLRTHTGERPYRCSGCGRHFSQRSCFHKHSCQRRGPTT